MRCLQAARKRSVAANSLKGLAASFVPESIKARAAAASETDEDRQRKANVASLVDAVTSQASFVRRVLRLGPRIINEAYIDRAVDRYCNFLALAKENPGQMLVPTLDVDLIWHAHMLSPDDYAADCAALLGRPLSHDASLGAEDLARAFERTKDMWHKRTDQPYVRPPQPNTPYRVVDRRKQYRDTSAGCGSACGSCGWGDHDFHNSANGPLSYHDTERQQVEEEYGPDVADQLDASGEDSSYFPEPDAWAHDADASSSSFFNSEDVDNSSDGDFWGSVDGDGGGDGGDCGGGCGGGD